MKYLTLPICLFLTACNEKKEKLRMPVIHFITGKDTLTFRDISQIDASKCHFVELYVDSISGEQVVTLSPWVIHDTVYIGATQTGDHNTQNVNF